MLPETLEQLMKELRRKPLFAADAADNLGYDRAGVERLIPHRAPFLLIDTVDGLDREARTVKGSRRIPADDPVFAGHFPGQPVYPGVLQVEMMGQLGLCLAGLLSADEAGEDSPPQVRATRIHQAIFVEPVMPSDRLTVMAGMVDDNGLTAICAGQVFRDRTLCSCAVQEVCFVG